MSCDAHERFDSFIYEAAHADFWTLNEREPTEEELEEYAETLRDKWL